MSGFRAKLRTGCAAVLTTYQQANPARLAHALDHRPTVYRTPCAFVDNVIASPRIVHDSGTRTITYQARIVVVNKYVTNEQAADEQDALVDDLVDAFSDTPHAVAGALIEPVSVDGEELTDGDATYAASVIVVQGTIQTGR